MGRFLFHALAIAVALAVAVRIVPGLQTSSALPLIVAAIVLGLINAVIKPILVILTLPITILTLGLFYLVINSMLLALTALLVPGFTVGSFWSAFFGAVIVSIVSSLIGALRPS